MSIPPNELPSPALTVPPNVWLNHILPRVKTGQDLLSLAATSGWLRRMIINSSCAQQILWPRQFSRELLECNQPTHGAYFERAQQQTLSERRMVQAVLHNDDEQVLQILEYCGVMYQVLTKLRTLDSVPVDQTEVIIDRILDHINHAAHPAKAEILAQVPSFMANKDSSLTFNAVKRGLRLCAHFANVRLFDVMLTKIATTLVSPYLPVTNNSKAAQLQKYGVCMLSPDLVAVLLLSQHHPYPAHLMLKYLLMFDFVTAKINDGTTNNYLFLAELNNQQHCAQVLRQHGADENTFLNLLIHSNNFATLAVWKRLTMREVNPIDLNTLNVLGYRDTQVSVCHSPLINTKEGLQCFIDCGLDLHSQLPGSRGLPVIFWLGLNCANAFEYLLTTQQFDINMEIDNTHLLHICCVRNQADSADKLLLHGADVNYALTKTGETALHISSYSIARKHIICFLLRRGADPDLPDLQGRGALNPIQMELRVFFQKFASGYNNQDYIKLRELMAGERWLFNQLQADLDKNRLNFHANLCVLQRNAQTDKLVTFLVKSYVNIYARHDYRLNLHTIQARQSCLLFSDRKHLKALAIKSITSDTREAQLRVLLTPLNKFYRVKGILGEQGRKCLPSNQCALALLCYVEQYIELLRLPNIEKRYRSQRLALIEAMQEASQHYSGRRLMHTYPDTLSALAATFTQHFVKEAHLEDFYACFPSTRPQAAANLRP